MIIRGFLLSNRFPGGVRRKIDRYGQVQGTWGRLVAVVFKQNNAKKAQEYMEVALRTGSKNPELLRQASEIELALGNEQESKKLVAVARKVNPNPVL